MQIQNVNIYYNIYHIYIYILYIDRWRVDLATVRKFIGKGCVTM